MDAQAFQTAKNALKAKDYKAAERAFKIAFDTSTESDEKYNIVLSYYGLAQVLNSSENGLLLCREAASNEMYDGNVFLNLAGAELASGNRKRAIDAIQHGLKADPGHYQLMRACARLDCRQKCCIAFLPREHMFNRALGRMRRRSGQELTCHRLLY